MSAQQEPAVVIACDESGNDGENNLGGVSRVFAHASVQILADDAASIMSEVRGRTGSQSAELKSSTLLRKKNVETVRWLLEHELVRAKASVHLTHKKFFIVSKLFDATVEETMHGWGVDMYEGYGALVGATLLHYLAPEAYGDGWTKCLNTFQKVLRSKDGVEARTQLVDLRDVLLDLLSREDALVRDLVGNIFAGIDHLSALSALQIGDTYLEKLRTIDPLLPAIGAATRTWSDRTGMPVKIVHDEAKVLTPQRIESLRYHLARPELVSPSHAGTGIDLAGVQLVDSKQDERVQVADLIAGLGRKAGEDWMAGKPGEILELMSSFISEFSIWPSPENMDIHRVRSERGYIEALDTRSSK